MRFCRGGNSPSFCAAEMPADLGVSPQGAKTRAGRIDENPVERAQGGHARGVRRVDGCRSHIKPHSPRRGLQGLELAFLDVGGNELPRVFHQGRQVGCLAAGTRAEIQDPLASCRRQEPGDKLRGLVLHVEKAAGNLRHFPQCNGRFCQDDPLRGITRRPHVMTGAGEPLQHVLPGCLERLTRRARGRDFVVGPAESRVSSMPKQPIQRSTSQRGCE